MFGNVIKLWIGLFQIQQFSLRLGKRFPKCEMYASDSIILFELLKTRTKFNLHRAKCKIGLQLCNATIRCDGLMSNSQTAIGIRCVCCAFGETMLSFDWRFLK